MQRTLIVLTILALGLAACGGPPERQPPTRGPAPAEATRPPRPTTPAAPPTAAPAPTQSPPTADPLPTSAPAPTAAAPADLQRPARLQIGLNFIRYFMDVRPGQADSLDTTTPYLQPESFFAGFAALGVQAYRQFPKADLLWDVIEPQDDQWNFQAADAVIMRPGPEPLVTLFAMQYASGTPPWAAAGAPFEKTLGPEAQEYLAAVVERYGPYVKYWEIGNEMDHWRAVDPGSPPSPDRLPAVLPTDGFKPEEQGVFLAQAAEFIRARDPDAVIVMPGLAGLDDYILQTWLSGVFAGGGVDWFDVVNYHFYNQWDRYDRMRQNLQQVLDQYGLTDRPVWQTETGTSSSATLTVRTDYPNSLEAQAADVFRRLVAGYAAGDDLIIWHTFIGSGDGVNNDWRWYGLLSEQNEVQPSYYTFRLFTQELLPFQQVQTLTQDPRGVNAYAITTEAGATRWVAWGQGAFTAPAGASQYASVIPAADGSFNWQTVTAGQSLPLAPEPILIK